MNQPRTDNHDLPDYDPDADIQFRQPPQVLAIVTLILGVFSFVALFKTTFWILPVVTIALGTASLFSLARNPEKIGRKAVLIGLVLAVFFGSWAASRYFSRQQWLCGHARRNADAWLKLVHDKKLREAHQLHLPQDERVAEGVTMEEYYATEQYAEYDYDDFFSPNPLGEFVKVAPQATIDFVRFEGYESIEDHFVLRYIARYEVEGEQKELVMRLVMRRGVDPISGDGCWTVDSVLPDEDAS